MAGLLGDNDPNDTGLLANDPKQILALSLLQAGLGTMGANGPGVSAGQALGAGGVQGINTYIAGNNAMAAQALRKAQAQKYGLETQKLGYDVQNLQRQNQMFGQLFGAPGAQPASPQGATATPASAAIPAAPAAAPASPGGFDFSTIGLTPDQVKAAYAFGGPGAASKLIEAAATKRIETGQWEDVGGGMQRNKLTGETKPMSPSLVNVAVNGPQQESEFRKTLGTEQGKDAAGIFKEADSARNQLVNVQRLNQLVDEWKAGGGSQGQLAPLQAKITAYAQAVGIDPSSLNLPKDAGPSQAIDALMRKMALGNIGGGSGGIPANNFSEADRNFIVDMQPTLKDTPEGFQAKLEMVKRMSERSTQKEELWMQMDEQGKSFSDFRRAWAKYTKDNPLFSDDEKKQIRAVSQSAAAPSISPDAARQELIRRGVLKQ